MSTQNFKLMPYLLLLFISILSCKKDISSINQEEQLSSSSPIEMTASRVTTREICFTAIAELTGCIGEHIKFGGIVELRESTVVGGNGVTNYIRQWSVRDLTGQGIVAGGTINNTSTTCPRAYNGTTTTNVYDIVAGHEMFSVKDPNTTTGAPNAVLSGDIYIHQGTVVFVNRVTGERIVARHEVIKNPQGIHRSGWFIRGQKC